MRFLRTPLLTACLVAGATSLAAQTAPPLSAFLMPRDAELALARTAAPPGVVDRATFKVLTPTGYVVASTGTNGFTCVVMRGWAAPTYTPAQFRDFVYDAKIRAPICYNAEASRTVLAYQELRAKLGMAGKSPAQIATAVEAAYARGEIPPVSGPAYAYMFSGDQNLGGPIGAWHPHMMVFVPYATNAMLGATEFGTMTPFVSDDAGTPFAVTVIPVDHTLARHLARAAAVAGGVR